MKSDSTTLTRNLFVRFILRGCSLVPVLGLVACGSGGTTEPMPASVLVTPEAVDLFVDESYGVEASVWDDAGHPVDAPITWTSSNPAVVTVSEGELTATGAGDATVFARSGGVEATIEVRVVEVLQLDFPLHGVLNEDYWQDWGVPHERPGEGPVDVLCGPKVLTRAFGGVRHQGVDYALKDMLVMDTGVTVYAAAAGTVAEIHDGEDDRNIDLFESSPPANYVVLEHADGIRTVYSSLRKYSVSVEVGQSVTVGDPLGEIGSSGVSSLPHLHFEVQLGERSVDPYSGPCGTGPRLWREPLEFDGDPHFIRAWVSDYPQAARRHYLYQAPGPADTIVAGHLITPWAQRMNAPANVSLGLRIINGEGKVRYDIRAANLFPKRSMFWVHRPFRSDTITVGGTWVMEYWYDGEVAAVDSFVLVIPEPR